MIPSLPVELVVVVLSALVAAVPVLRHPWPGVMAGLGQWAAGSAMVFMLCYGLIIALGGIAMGGAPAAP